MSIDQPSADLAAQQQANQHSSDGVTSRRQAIATWARAAGRAFAPAAAIGAAGAAVMSMPSQRASASPMDVPADVDPGSLVAKLASRVSFGVTPELLAEANTLGYDAFLERQLNPESIPESASTTAYLGAIPALTVPPAQLWDETLFPSDELLANQLTEATIYRASFSSRQLLERMVEFWHDHFNFDLAQDQAQRPFGMQDRVVRQLALTTFPQILRATAQSSLMMNYLDNAFSSAGNLNENYARELMELHTLGAEFLYSFPTAEAQATIVAVARCLTGWGWYRDTYNDTTPGGNGTANRGLFYYNNTANVDRAIVNGQPLFGVRAGVHDTNAKVLGTLFGSMVIPARSRDAGIQDGLDVLAALSAHPQTAAFIARKLCIRFLGEGVPSTVVNSVRDAYLDAANPQGIGDIKAMLRVMLRPNNVASAFPRFKRPFHLVCSILRASGAQVDSLSLVRQALSRAGHPPFRWNPPDGYPDTTAYWSGLLLPRWNFASTLCNNSLGTAPGLTGVTIDEATFFAGASSTREQVVNRINQRVFLGAMPDSERTAILNFLPPSPTAAQRRDALGLAFCAPSFQWY